MSLSAGTLGGLKVFYNTDAGKDVTYKRRALYAMMKKKKFSGYTIQQPIWVANPSARSADFETMLAAVDQGRALQATITDVPNYAGSYVTTQDILASKGAGKEAFWDLLTKNIDGALSNLANDLAADLYGDGTGARGQVGASPQAGYIYLKTDADISKFEKGMTLVAASSTTGALRSGSAAITGVSYVAGSGWKLTGPGTSAITSLAADDYLFVSGDAPNNTGDILKIGGIGTWCGTGALYGITRTSEDQRRVSVIDADYTSSGTPKQSLDLLTDMVMQVKIQGGQVDYVFANPAWVLKLQADMQSKAQIVNVKPDDMPTVGFKGVTVPIYGGDGLVTVVEDIFCPSNYVYGLEMDSWTLYHRTEQPVSPISADGNEILRSNSNDGVIFRGAFYGNVGCSAPGHNIRGKVA